MASNLPPGFSTSMDYLPAPNTSQLIRLVVTQSTVLPHGAVIDVSEDLTIGRDWPSSGTGHLRIPELSVSRLHAKLYQQEEEEEGEISDDLWIKDLGSTHGTVVNGHRISEPHRLQHKDAVMVGETGLQIHVHEQWGCHGCSTQQNQQIPTVRPQKEPRKGPVGPVDPVEAIKAKYGINDRHALPNGYTDRARLRRVQEQPSINQPVKEEEEENEEVCYQGREGLGAQPESPRSRHNRIARQRFYS